MLLKLSIWLPTPGVSQTWDLGMRYFFYSLLLSLVLLHLKYSYKFADNNKLPLFFVFCLCQYIILNNFLLSLVLHALRGYNILYYLYFSQILLTVAEHHSNIVPWQLVAQRTDATLKYVNLTEGGVPDIEQLKQLLSTKTKLVVTHHVSNVLGRLHLGFLDFCIFWALTSKFYIFVYFCR